MLANPGTIVVSESFGGNMAEYMGSLEKLLKIESKLLIPAHGMPLGQPKLHIQKLLDHRLWRETRIQEAYDSGARTMDDLLARTYDDVPEAALMLARHSLKAHLKKLRLSLDE